MKKITLIFAFLLFSILGFAQPTTNAPTPTRLASNVVSVYSDAYTSVATNLNPGWGQSGTVNPTFSVTAGNNIMAYTNFNYQGTDLTATNLSTMEYLHIDIWTNAAPSASIVKVSPINSGTGAAEVLVTINHVQGQWYSVDIPKSSFTGMTWDNVIQLKFAANGAGSTTPIDIYLDNIYFWKAPAANPNIPSTNAPTPTRLAANVASIYSDAYTSIATNLNPGWGQSGAVNPTYTVTAGNNILAYTNFNYQGTEVTATNLSTMEFLHVDIWTNAAPSTSIVKVSPINSGTGAAEVLVTLNHVQGQWYSVDIPKASFTGMTWDNIIQLKFAANGAGSTTPIDIYLDNIYFWKAPASTVPTTNAPTPTRLAANVASVYSDAYTSIATNLNPGWGQSGSVNPTFTVTAGNNILAYTNFNYQGTETITSNLSTMEFLHVDIWTNAAPSSSIVKVSPINSGTGAAEVLVTIDHVQGQWYSVDIPKASFTGMTWDNIIQLKFAANGAGSTTPIDIYLDNIYFWKTPSTNPNLPTTNAPTPTRLAENVASIFSDAYTSIATNLNPNWGQSGAVNPTFTVSGGNNILAYTNFNYQGTEVTATNLSTMEFLHIDVWSNASPANTILKVSPISNAGGASEFLVTINHVQGQWYSVDIPKSAFTGMTWTNVYQLKFAANGAGSTVPADFYFDNIYFWKTPVDPAADATLSDLKVDGNTIAGFGAGVINYTYELLTGTTIVPQITAATTTNTSATRVITQATGLPGSATVVVTSANGLVTKTYTVNYVVTGPATNAPTPPARPTSDVVSLFSNAYTNIAVSEWSAAWDDSTIQDIVLSGNDLKKINFTNFLGVQFAGYHDATQMTHFHMDYYIDAGTDLTGKVLNPKWSNHAAQAGETSALLLTHLPVTTGSWVSIDVPLSSFGGTGQARNSLNQFLITSNLGAVYVDNIYLHKNTLSSDNFSALKVKLYPNPTTSVLNIESAGIIQSIAIYNVLGQEVLNRTIDSTSARIDVASFNSGIYVVKSVIDGVTSSSKFIKE